MVTENKIILNQLKNAIRQILNSGHDTPLVNDIVRINREIKNDSWKSLIDLGALSANISIESGGTELGEEVILLFLEEIGKQCVRVPYVDCLFLSDILQSKTGERIDDSQLIALAEGKGQVSLITANVFPSEYKVSYNCHSIFLNGYLGQVHSSQVSEKYLLALKDSEKIKVIAVEKSANGLLLKKSALIEELDIISVYTSQININAENVISQYDISCPKWSLILSKIRIRQAAYLLGLCQGVFTKVTQYISQRSQFEKKLIDFQAVAFRAAELFAEIQIMKARIAHAAELVEMDLLTSLFATETLALIAELALKTVKEAVHLHGAYGMTNQSSIPHFYKTVSFESMRFGTPLSLWQEISHNQFQTLTKVNNR